MELRFSPLFSGSSGNAAYIGCGNSHFLIDSGVSGSRIAEQLKEIGVPGEQLCGILVTHEHSDHSSGVGVLSRRFDLPVYATEGTWAGMHKKVGRIDAKNRRIFEPGQDFFLGDMNVMPFSIPHDANDPVGFSFQAGKAKVSIATDIGCIKESWMKWVEGSDIVLLEANHDEQMLQAGSYTYELKRRILSRKGHLSNENAGKALAELVRRGVKSALLGHLSQENNFPELAYETVALVLKQQGIVPGIDVGLAMAQRNGMSGLYSIRETELPRCVLGQQNLMPWLGVAD